MFGSITGLDPRSLGAGDTIASDLGISAANAAALQRYATEQLAVEEVPEPGMAVMFLTLGGLMCLARRPKSARG
jgi:hypothetical protein